MRKLITFFLLLWAVILHAQQITPDEAAAIASEFLSSSSPQLTTAKRVGVKRAKAKSDADNDLAHPYYVFNGDDNRGFVIVSGDKRAKKILGYSNTGTFDFDNLPPQLAAMLEQYAEQIESLPASATIDPSWSTPTHTASTGEGKLLETANWGQGYPYNLQCPEVDGQKCLTGCVATAMAIVMKYHNWPEKGRSFNDIVIDGKITHVDFSQYIFDYDNMPLNCNADSEDTQPDDISTLMYAAGRSVYMDYNAVESSAYFQIVSHQLQEKFSYSANCEFLMGKDYSWDKWIEIILNELNNNRPILYAGTSDVFTKHAFVCDGYSAEGLFHINWGWNGIDNGYFSLDKMIYSYEPCMVINIIPDTSGTLYARPYILHDDIYTLFEEADFINVSLPSITQNTPFDIGSPTIRTPYGFNGELGFCLTDNAGKIKEILGTHKIYSDGYHPYLAYGEGIDFQLFGVTISETIEKSDEIHLIARESENDDWKFILGCAAIPSSISVENCNNKICEIRLNTNPYFIIETQNPVTGNVMPITNVSYTQLFGSHLQFWCHIKEGAPNGYGVISAMGKGAYNDNNYYICGLGDERLGFAFKAIDNYIINGEFYEYTAPLKLDIKTAGTLSTLISTDDAHRVGDLTLSGNINAFDIWYVRENMKGLYRLDLSETTIKGVETSGVTINSFPVSGYQPDNAMPDWALEHLSLLQEVILPSNLKYLQDTSLSGLKISNITLPASIEDFGTNNFFASSLLDEVVNLNPIPIPIRECNFTGTKCPEWGCLIVPEESLSAYKKAPVWGDFKYIYALGTILPKTIEIQEPTLAIGIAESKKMQVVFFPENTNVKDLQWESDNEFVVSVSKDGIITGVNYGSANVTAYTSNNRFATCQVTVNPIMVKTLTINPKTWSGNKGESFQITTIVTPENATNKTVTWTSSNTDVATVDANGKVTAITVGEATITATAADDSGVSATCQVTVNPIMVETLTINPETWSGTESESFQITAVVTPEDATDKTVAWSSSDETVAIVNATGYVNVLKGGNCVITVSTQDGSGLSAECIITCISDIDNIFTDASARFDVYNLQGILVKKDCGRNDLKQLPTGTYILRQEDISRKIIIQ